MTNHTNGSDPRPEGSEPMRRDFLRKAGGALFGFVFLSAYGGAAGPANQVPPPPVQTCVLSPHDPDENCGQSSEADEACFTTPSATPGAPRDEDENCGAAVGGSRDVDNACGDCDDNHDTDESCGTSVGDAKDSDQLCGHPHFVGGAEDQRCAKAVPGSSGSTYADQGCGVHDPVYSPGFADKDQNCGLTLESGATDIDSNCSKRDADVACGTAPPAYASDPDEKCSASDKDEGCGQSGTPGYGTYTDKDESCGVFGADAKDEGCGGTAGLSFDPDENCSLTDVDESCGKKAAAGSYGVPDESCSQTAADEGCQYHSNTFTPSYWDEDQHCGQGGDRDEACNAEFGDADNS